MTLEETIKDATPTGGTYQRECPGDWIAYAAKSPDGGFICHYVKESDPDAFHALVKKRVQSFAKWGKM